MKKKHKFEVKDKSWDFYFKKKDGVYHHVFVSDENDLFSRTSSDPNLHKFNVSNSFKQLLTKYVVLVDDVKETKENIPILTGVFGAIGGLSAYALSKDLIISTSVSLITGSIFLAVQKKGLNKHELYLKEFMSDKGISVGNDVILKYDL